MGKQFQNHRHPAIASGQCCIKRKGTHEITGNVQEKGINRRSGAGNGGVPGPSGIASGIAESSESH